MKRVATCLARLRLLAYSGAYRGFRNMTLLGAAAIVGGIILTKFMMSLRDENYRVLTGAAIDRGISVQELLRAVIIPDWVKETPRGIVADNWPSVRPRR